MHNLKNVIAILLFGLIFSACAMLPGHKMTEEDLVECCKEEQGAEMQSKDDAVNDVYRVRDIERQFDKGQPQKAKEVDTDGDGVTDGRDDCPKTAPGVAVSDNGCWSPVVLSDVLFDYDKYSLKPDGRVVLDAIIDKLNANPELILEMSGHTDNIGSMDYNVRLSKNRVEEGKKYLGDKGISPSRISTGWHSFSMPKASNDTPGGRAINRRLEFAFVKP